MRLHVKIHSKNLLKYLAHSKPSINGSYTNNNFEKYVTFINVILNVPEEDMLD